jgi:dihydroceramidase
MELVRDLLVHPDSEFLTDAWYTSVLYRNPVYHQVVFALLMLSTAVRVQYLLRRLEASKRVPNTVRALIGTLFTKGLGLFALGFFVWNLDNIFCTALTRQKVAIGWPIAFLLEGAFSICFSFSAELILNFPIGHAWWHILTGTGAQLMLVGITCKLLYDT